MPQVVDIYRKTKSFEDADRIKKEFLRCIVRIDKFRSKFKGKIGQPYILYTKDVLVKEKKVYPNNLCPCGRGKNIRNVVEEIKENCIP